MGALILVLMAVFALSESDILHLNTASSKTQTYVDADEGDIGQIFGTDHARSGSISVIVEEPLAAAPVTCHQTTHQTTQLVRDLTVPYSQRTYIRPDGTSCTPVE